MSALPELRCSHDGEWFWLGSLAIYPRDNETWSIGRHDSGSTYRDVETGFANAQAAIDHAEWMLTKAGEA